MDFRRTRLNSTEKFTSADQEESSKMNSQSKDKRTKRSRTDLPKQPIKVPKGHSKEEMIDVNRFRVNLCLFLSSGQFFLRIVFCRSTMTQV